MSGWAVRGGLAAVVLAAMATGRVITDHIPTDDLDSRPFVHAAKVGQTAHLRYGDVRVDGLRAAHEILSAGSSYVAPHGFLVVDVTFTGRNRDGSSLGGLELVDREGRHHAPSDRACVTRIGGADGVPWHVMLCYQVAASALPGIQLEVAPSSSDLQGQDQERDDLARIDLGIDAAKAREITGSKDVVKFYNASINPYGKKPCTPKPGQPGTVLCTRAPQPGRSS